MRSFLLIQSIFNNEVTNFIFHFFFFFFLFFSRERINVSHLGTDQIRTILLTYLLKLTDKTKKEVYFDCIDFYRQIIQADSKVPFLDVLISERIVIIVRSFFFFFQNFGLTLLFFSFLFLEEESKLRLRCFENVKNKIYCMQLRRVCR